MLLQSGGEFVTPAPLLEEGKKDSPAPQLGTDTSEFSGHKALFS